MSNFQRGFAPIYFVIGFLSVILLIAGGIYFVQRSKNEPVQTKPGVHLQQIANPENAQSQGNSEGQSCGGFAGISCAAGLTCQLEGNNPDALGKCIKE